MAEPVTIEQLPDGVESQNTDLFYIRRPDDNGNYSGRKISADKVINGKTGLTQLSSTFTTSNLAAGTFYNYGSYLISSTDANLTQGSPSQTHGTAGAAYYSNAFVVVSGVGTVDTGVIELVVTGTSRTEDGVNTPADSEILVADITDATTVTTDALFTTSKKWLGQVTFTLQTSSGAPTTYSFDFNYGLVNAENVNQTDFNFDTLQVDGMCATTDTVGFTFELFQHTASTYSYISAGFAPSNPFVRFDTAYAGNADIIAGEGFHFKQSGFDINILGSQGEGFIMRTQTGVANAVQYMNINVGIK